MVGILRASEGKDILIASQLPKSDLKRIWDLCDRVDDKTLAGPKGFLRKQEWILCLHLITYAKQGFPIPGVIPQEIEAYLNNYKEMNLKPQAGFGNNSVIQNSSYTATQNPLDSSSNNTSRTNTQTPNTSGSQPQNYQNFNSTSTTIREPVSLQPQTTSLGQTNSQTIGNNTKSLEVLERVVKAYEVLSKKYSDEVENHTSETNRIQREKYEILTNLQMEISRLFAEFGELEKLGQELSQEINISSSKQSDSESASVLSQLSIQIDQTLNQNKTLEVFESLRRRARESGVNISPVYPTQPPPTYSFRPQGERHEPALRNEIIQIDSREAEEEDMFA